MARAWAASGIRYGKRKMFGGGIYIGGDGTDYRDSKTTMEHNQNKQIDELSPKVGSIEISI